MTIISSISRQGQSEPFEFQVSRGQIQGHTAIQFSGFNPDVDTTWESIAPGGPLIFPSAELQMKVSSTSALDTSTGTGARTVLITGLDGDYNVITESVTLNGQTAVTTTNSFFRINGLAVTSTGSDKTAGGTIYVGTGTVTGGVPATVYDQIPLGWNSRQSGAYTIPAGYTGFTTYARFTLAQAAGTDSIWGRLTLTGTNGVKMAVAALVTNNGIVTLQPSYPIPVPEKTTVMGEAMGAANDNRVATVIMMTLVKNDGQA